MKYRIFVLIAMTAIPFFARGQDSEMRLATSYFDAKDYGQAAAEFKALMDDSLPSWKRTILYYNIGTALLADGKYDGALANFQYASALNGDLPLLNARLTVNRALALLLSANAHASQAASDDDYSQALALYKLASTEAGRANEAFCALMRAEGAATCAASSVSEQIRLQAKTQYDKLLQEYLSFFIKSLAQLSSKKITIAGSTIQDTLKQLEELLTQAAPNQLLEVALQRLLIGYRLIFIQESPQKTLFQAVLKAQEALKTQIAASPAPVKEAYAKAQEYLAMGVTALDENHLEKARLFAMAARFFIVKIADAAIPNTKNTAETTLERSIKQQEMALLINRLLLQIPTGKGVKDAGPIPVEVQTNVLQGANDFVETALKQQRIAFEGFGKDRCQCSPWDEVIPLFSAGYAKANGAREAANAASAIPFQEGAIKDWKEALKKLRSKEAKPREQKQMEKPPEEGKQPISNVMRLVQEMESDDRSNPVIEVQGNKGEERPW